jgi:hypothetical protein
LGDKAHSVIFDNSKIRRLVPEFNPRISFEQGASEITAWYASHPEFQVVDAGFNGLLDRVIADVRR